MLSNYSVFTLSLLFFATATATTTTSSGLLISPSHEENQVFVSFRGVDIRKGFVSHLVRELSRKKVSVFLDSEMERGEEIWGALTSAIQRSRISLVIFSANYASSRWCLDELLKILECRDRQGQIVIPVFYNVDPSEVRHQRGSFGNSLIELENKYGELRTLLWKSALTYTADLAGFHSPNFQNDAELLDEIVSYISKKLTEGLTGIENPIVIWGMGGRGKITTEEEVIYRLCHESSSCVLLASVKEESRRHGIISLKQKLFSAILKENLKIDITYELPMRFVYVKVLIGLDDVNNSDHLEILVGAPDWFESGTRIIVTNRNKCFSVIISF